ncbi:Putative defective protein IntQ [Enterobacter cloacae]|nr:Putative defective protein IntQ [Enterobacter cloacae]
MSVVSSISQSRTQLLTAYGLSGANPSFIASQTGHENAKMVYEVYSKWRVGMNADQVGMLNERLQTLLPPGCPQG